MVTLPPEPARDSRYHTECHQDDVDDSERGENGEECQDETETGADHENPDECDNDDAEDERLGHFMLSPRWFLYFILNHIFIEVSTPLFCPSQGLFSPAGVVGAILSSKPADRHRTGMTVVEVRRVTTLFLIGPGYPATAPKQALSKASEGHADVERIHLLISA